MVMKSFLLFFLFSCCCSFTVMGAFMVPAAAPSFHRVISSPSTTRLYAEGVAPEYTKRDVVLINAEPVADGSAVLLHIDRPEGDTEPFDYRPGHVLALEIKYNETRDTFVDAKTMKDAKTNNMWMRGPYTVSSATTKTINILLKIVGTKSKAFSKAEPGTLLKLGGKFKVPIVDGISDNTSRVVLISTGVGVGPCVGAVEQLVSGPYPFLVELVSCFRTSQQVIYDQYLKFWQEAYPTKLQYTPLITSEQGRLSACSENLKLIVNNDFCSLTETHYHLIGNGQMMKEFKQGLLKAGVLKEKITSEVYFNHKAEPSQEAIDRIAEVVRAAAMNPAKS